MRLDERLAYFAGERVVLWVFLHCGLVLSDCSLRLNSKNTQLSKCSPPTYLRGNAVPRWLVCWSTCHQVLGDTSKSLAAKEILFQLFYTAVSSSHTADSAVHYCIWCSLDKRKGNMEDKRLATTPGTFSITYLVFKSARFTVKFCLPEIPKFCVD